MTFCDLTGKRALVTGGSRGIGKEIAHQLVAAGADVLITGTNADSLKAAQQEIGAAGFIVANLADEADWERLIAEAGQVDILVNNAGITKDGLFPRQSQSHWDEVFKVNLEAAVVLSRGFLPGMLKQRWGRIIQITSVVAHMGNTGQTNYIASKAALTGFTKGLAQEVARRGITVNAVAPGFIETAMTAEVADAAVARLTQAIPMQRFGTPAEVAHTVRFLASAEAAYLTGTTLHVNGGMYM